MKGINEQYSTLLKKILNKGTWRSDPNRNKVYRLNLPFYNFSVDLRQGFPAISTKKLFWKGVVGELLWFLNGDTNIKYLIDNDINIWNQDAYRYYTKLFKEHNPQLFGTKLSYEEFIEVIYNSEDTWVNTGIPNYTFGDLGAIYGSQWTNWDGRQREGLEGINQISNLIKNLKDNELSSSHIVSSWNPSEIYDCAVPPCHWSFQVTSQGPYLDLIFNMRSTDVFLGLPFNVASYALLLSILAELTGKLPRFLKFSGTNVHLYHNQLVAAKEQLKYNPSEYFSPSLQLPKINSLQDVINSKIENFILKDYNPSSFKPKVKMLTYSTT